MHVAMPLAISSLVAYPLTATQSNLNGAIHITCIILKLDAASAAEAELGALFLNAQESKVFCLSLDKLGHSQPPTPIHINNTTTVVMINNTINNVPVQWR
jgi:hypothetical protein